MSKEDVITARGEVIEAYPSALFRIRLENGRTIMGHLSGRLRQNHIRVLVGDWVDIDISPYDLTKGRITYRHRSKPAPIAAHVVTT